MKEVPLGLNFVTVEGKRLCGCRCCCCRLSIFETCLQLLFVVCKASSHLTPVLLYPCFRVLHSCSLN